MRSLLRRLTEDRMLAVSIVVAIGARVLFWVLTERVWEDALITVAHARNAAEGLGLTHHQGEPPTHGFTSALSVLIPLLGEMFVRESGIFVLRVVSLFATVVTLIYANAVAHRVNVDKWGRLFLLMFLSLEQNHIFYGMSGMETQVAVAILVMGIYYLFVDHAWKAGLASGIGVLARPDFVIWLAPVLLYFSLRSWRKGIASVIPAVGVIVPWIIFTTIYYGSFVPQTVRAKAAVYVQLPKMTEGFSRWLEWGASRVEMHVHTFWRFFTPFYADSFVVATPFPRATLLAVSIAILGLAVLGMLVGGRDRMWWPVIVFVLGFIVYRVAFLNPGYFDWYMPPLTGSVAILAAVGLSYLTKSRANLQAPLSLLLLAPFAACLPFLMGIERRVQTVEEEVRVPLSKYLQQVIREDETLVSESAGYVGYYSHGVLLDFPGLTSKHAFRILKSLPPARRSLTTLMAETNPDWAVMRPAEYEAFVREFPNKAARYVEVRRVRFHTTKGNVAFGGVEKLNVDREFLVLRRI